MVALIHATAPGRQLHNVSIMSAPAGVGSTTGARQRVLQYVFLCATGLGKHSEGCVARTVGHRLCRPRLWLCQCLAAAVCTIAFHKAQCHNHPMTLKVAASVQGAAPGPLSYLPVLLQYYIQCTEGSPSCWLETASMPGQCETSPDSMALTPPFSA